MAFPIRAVELNLLLHSICTIEQVNVTPVSRLEFILSKIIPYWTVGVFIVAFWAVVSFSKNN